MSASAIVTDGLRLACASRCR